MIHKVKIRQSRDARPCGVMLEADPKALPRMVQNPSFAGLTICYRSGPKFTEVTRRFMPDSDANYFCRIEKSTPSGMVIWT